LTVMDFLFQGTKPVIAKTKHQGFQSTRTRPLKRRQSDEEEDHGRLPDEYASEILELEIQCEAMDVPIENIRKLMGLYTQAIDYYVAHQSEKYKYFQKKMANLMIQPQVVESMEVAHQRKVREAEISQIQSERNTLTVEKDTCNKDKQHSPKPNMQRVDIQMKRQKFEMHKNLNSIAQADKMKEILFAHEMATTRNNVIVQSSLKKQLESLSNRLQQRKAAVKTGSTTSGFTKEIQRETGEGSACSDSREKATQSQESGPNIHFQAGIKRCGSHKVLSRNKTEGESLFTKQ